MYLQNHYGMINSMHAANVFIQSYASKVDIRTTPLMANLHQFMAISLLFLHRVSQNLQETFETSLQCGNVWWGHVANVKGNSWYARTGWGEIRYTPSDLNKSESKTSRHSDNCKVKTMETPTSRCYQCDLNTNLFLPSTCLCAGSSSSPLSSPFLTATDPAK